MASHPAKSSSAPSPRTPRGPQRDGILHLHARRPSPADTALKTADSGYLTRKLVDASQDVIIFEDDCGTTQGIVVRPIYKGDEEVVDLATRLIGRVSCETVKDPVSGSTVVKKNHLVDEKTAHAIEKIGVEQLKIRSVLTCETKRGCCAKCYGRNLATGQMVKLGEPSASSPLNPSASPARSSLCAPSGRRVRHVQANIVKAKNDGEVRFTDLRVVRPRRPVDRSTRTASPPSPRTAAKSSVTIVVGSTLSVATAAT